MTTPDVQSKPTHGLAYPPTFLDSLPVLQPSSLLPQGPSTSSPGANAPPQLPYTVRALSAKQFAALHTAYLTTHAPDSVIFPFLHGLEGDNDQQNAFFASSAARGGEFCPTTPNGAPSAGANGQVVNFTERELRGLRAEVPRFRGLMWVASDEDEMEEYERAMQGRLAPNHLTPHPPSAAPPEFDDDALADDDDEDDDEDDGYSSGSSQPESELGHFGGLPMDVDEALDGEFDAAGARSMDMAVSMDVDGEEGVAALRGLEGAHMHPVVHHRPALAAIDTGAGKGKGERRSSPNLSFFRSPDLVCGGNLSLVALRFRHLWLRFAALVRRSEQDGWRASAGHSSLACA